MLAKEFARGMRNEDKITFALEMLLDVDDPALHHRVEAASNIIGQHGHTLNRERISRRSDGSVISPYAPDGGPLVVGALDGAMADVYTDMAATELLP